ncbi:hypothetical protein C5Y97_12185 [Blastopirellula marina]|uniref:Uncharacterized protein n=1 Tax=Blastopirellula marina TaxID=124 RepID=A0A2S8FW89_9BACT|nr:hypothetical protein C5Y98_12175 [Blastopirellula marina]PTL44289.1 hypothetical protein C5Y97_12185 [Blastopirellula marina]
MISLAQFLNEGKGGATNRFAGENRIQNPICGAIETCPCRSPGVGAGHQVVAEMPIMTKPDCEST